MSQNLISASLPPADAVAIRQHLTDVKSKLSFLLSLTPNDITGLVIAGNTYLPFIDLVHEVVQSHPEILSGVFDKDEFLRDYALLEAIRPILLQISELADSLQKTVYAVGSDNFVASLDVYAAVKLNKDKVPGLNVIADEMAKFFKKTKTKGTAGSNGESK